MCGIVNGFCLQLLVNCSQEISLGLVARRLSDVEIGWNGFRGPSLACRDLAGGSLAGVEQAGSCGNWGCPATKSVLDQIETAFCSLSVSPERGAYPKEPLALGIREEREIFSSLTASSIGSWIRTSTSCRFSLLVVTCSDCCSGDCEKRRHGRPALTATIAEETLFLQKGLPTSPLSLQ